MDQPDRSHGPDRRRPHHLNRNKVDHTYYNNLAVNAGTLVVHAFHFEGANLNWQMWKFWRRRLGASSSSASVRSLDNSSVQGSVADLRDKFVLEKVGHR